MSTRGCARMAWKCNPQWTTAARRAWKWEAWFAYRSGPHGLRHVAKPSIKRWKSRTLFSSKRPAARAETFIRGRRAEARAMTTDRAQNIKLLLRKINPLVRELIVKVRRSGEVEASTDGADAAAEGGRRPPDVILCDYHDARPWTLFSAAPFSGAGDPQLRLVMRTRFLESKNGWNEIFDAVHQRPQSRPRLPTA